jgi:transcriptional regulator with XRE-family HTH domain
MINSALLQKTTESGLSMSPQARSRADRQPHYMRQWRKSRGLTLQEMADAMNTLRGYEVILQPHLSRIELGHREYRQDILEAFSEVIGCKPADLLAGPPAIDPDAHYKALRRFKTRRR